MKIIYFAVPVLFKIEKYFFYLKIFRLYLVAARIWKKMVLQSLSLGILAYNIACCCLEKWSREEARR